jgi:hypothetical protein
MWFAVGQSWYDGEGALLRCGVMQHGVIGVDVARVLETKRPRGADRLKGDTVVCCRGRGDVSVVVLLCCCVVVLLCCRGLVNRSGAVGSGDGAMVRWCGGAVVL